MRIPVSARTSQAWLWRFNSAFALRFFFWVASFAVKQRSLKPQSTGQHRGDPPFSAAKSLLQQLGGRSKEEEARLKNS
jgi:hypothetical protein